MKHPLDTARDSLTGRPAREVLADIATAVRAGGSFFVAAHAGPDGDALGSCAALTLALRQLGKQARAFAVGDVPERYREMFPADVVEEVDPQQLAAAADKPDWFVVLDTSEPERLGELKDAFYTQGARRICIDHHPTDRGGRHDLELVVPQAPAAGSLVLGLLDELGVEPEGATALALWVAIATDTGWFRFSNTGTWALLDAARLAPSVGDVEPVYGRIYADLSLDRAHLLGRAFSAARAELDGALVWSAVSLVAGATNGASAGGDRRGRASDLDGLIDSLKTISGARVVALISEVEPEFHKVSLRALAGAEVAGIAQKFGGGGHAKAAGCRMSGSLDSVVARLRSAVKDYFEGR